MAQSVVAGSNPLSGVLSGDSLVSARLLERPAWKAADHTLSLIHISALEHLARADRRLARIIVRSGECRLQQETTQSIFEALLESIIYQQLNGKVAATITARVKALFPENTKRIRTRRGLVDGFPSPEQILAAPEELLRSCLLYTSLARWG